MTVFGDYNYGSKKGFLIIHKSDNYPIFNDDFDIFKTNSCTEVPAQDGLTGAYIAYLRPYQDLQKWLTSIKWGKWWDGND